MPAPPPAVESCQLLSVPKGTKALPMRFVAAEAGFFPPGPFTLFADIETCGLKKEKDS